MPLERRLIQAGRHAVIILLGIAMLYPVLWLVLSSFKPNHLIFNSSGLIPEVFTLDHYVNGWKGLQGVSFGRFFSNSLVISILSVIGNVVSCSLAAYAFSRLKFRLKGLWFSIMLVTIMLPYHVTLVPQYIMYNELHWINTYFPLILPKWLAHDSFFILLMVQFIRGIPRELDESATIDGCGQAQIFFRIVVPLLVPALITTSIFTFIWSWDDFFSQMIYLSKIDLFTVQLGIRSLFDPSGQSDWGALLAMSTLSLLPVTIIFLLFQRYFLEGIATTGLK
ncbi:MULTISPECIES: carbohydrate ABC transporter permease [Paenibacillus]|jgi:multiple sugar transport system permease protein|uniref:Binding-protein-dependent transport systems inner membrane component n=2 Tax=Paenibacillus lactis TaxID=228574 RepID=G4HHM2_9BACL|nr:carbohydrate ABC transporter permease [Paenibacillus lactis]EHB63598.1 binding-protein-dependent transport systems inner membrane component [Paenibacillus lactis 154]MBP1891881.1 multiple sugar transport system permease protein [Paenibacillus lactis]MCM3494343.1 carbohydrate ABC transporter permease [Paenibacillus lactis]HAF99325.1 carbohydrate ABC transporter permease [Paenibacillus lactis]